jgi:hypothetical protein
MPFRLARALRARFAAALRNRTARTGARSRCAADPLEDRRLLSVSILTPYQHDVEGDKVAIVADFTADALPSAAYVGWGDGTIKDMLLDYEPETDAGTAYALHEFATPGHYTVTFTLRQPGGYIDARTFYVDVPGEPAPAPDPGEANTVPSDGLASGNGSLAPDGALTDSGSSSAMSGTAPTVAAVYVDSTAWATSFRNYIASHGLGDYGYKVPDGTAQALNLPWTNLNKVKVRFSEDVVVVQNDLLLAGAGNPAYATSAFAYDAATYTATWSLPASLPAEKLLLQLRGTVQSVATGEALDGEWTGGRWVPQHWSG